MGVVVLCSVWCGSFKHNSPFSLLSFGDIPLREDMKDEIPIKNRLICDKDKLMCSIGLRNINIGEKYQHCNNCKNNFCSESLFEWHKTNKSCPCCRVKWDKYIIFINK